MNWKIIILVILVVAFTLYRSNETFIFFTDELQIEETNYQMHKTGDYLIPRFNGFVSFNKSPLYHWLTAPLYSVFPPNVLVRRFWTLVAGIGLTLLTYLFTRKYFNREIAFWSVLFLISNSLYIEYTKAANLDIPNAFFALLIIFLYNLSKKNTRYLYLLAVALGLSIFNRAYLAFIPLPAMIFDQIFLSEKKVRPRDLLLPFLLFIIITVPWHLTAYLLYPKEFIANFINYNLTGHVAEIATGDQLQPIWTYLSVFFYLPLSFFIFLGIIKLRFMDNNRRMIQQLTFLILSVFIILSLIKTRHLWYILPILPFISILTGYYFQYFLNRIKNETVKLVLIQFTVAVLLSPFLTFAITKEISAEPVRSLEIMASVAQTNDFLYTYPYPFIYNTTLYQPRKIINLDSSEKLIGIVSSGKRTYLLSNNLITKQLQMNKTLWKYIFRGKGYPLIVIN